MPMVKVYPHPSYDPLGVRVLLGQIGVSGPMLQDETSITCSMTEQQISNFVNGRGAAHRLVVQTPEPPAPEPPAPIVEGALLSCWPVDDDPAPEPSAPEPPAPELPAPELPAPEPPAPPTKGDKRA